MIIVKLIEYGVPLLLIMILWRMFLVQQDMRKYNRERDAWERNEHNRDLNSKDEEIRRLREELKRRDRDNQSR